MDIDKLREEIAYDEGSVNKIYLDHLGLPTFGIGHLVIDSDPEHGQPKLEHLSQKIDAIPPSTKTLKQCLTTAQYYMTTSMICQKKLKE